MNYKNLSHKHENIVLVAIIMWSLLFFDTVALASPTTTHNYIYYVLGEESTHSELESNKVIAPQSFSSNTVKKRKNRLGSEDANSIGDVARKNPSLHEVNRTLNSLTVENRAPMSSPNQLSMPAASPR